MDSDTSSSAHVVNCPSECRAVSPVFSAFPWATPHVVHVPKPLTDFTDVMSPHKHLIDSLNRFERSLFAFDKLAVNSTELAPILGLDVPKASHAVTLHPTATTASSKGEYKTLASILCAYRTFEVLALDCETGVSQPPIRLLPPLAFNKSEQDSEKLVGFDKLENWPKVLLNFRKLMGQAGLPQIPDDLHAGSKHLALLQMASKNNEKVGYVNVADNFLQAALHLYYLKMTQFPEGSLPDYPDILSGRLRIFKDETSTDEFINDQEEGNYYLQDLRGGETASHSLHQLGTPLQLALLLTPFYLLFPSRIITRSYNRRLVIESFAELTPRKTPLVLKIERSIWRSLIALANVTITPHEALTQLVSRLPWAEIEAASNNPRDRRMFCTPLAQPSSSSIPLQPGLAVGRQLAIEGASNTLTPDIQVSGPMSEASVIPNTQCSTSIGDNASCINEEHPEARSTPSPMDQDGGSPIPPTPLPISERPESSSTPPQMDQDSGSLTHPMQLPTSDRPESPPQMDHDGGSPMPESLETSLASALQSVFQSRPILSPHLGTVNPSHISLPLNLLRKNLSGQEDIEMGALSELSSSSEDEDSEHLPARSSKKIIPEVKSSDNDDTDDEESSSSSSDESIDSGVKKPIGNTSSKRGRRGNSGNLKKHRVGSSKVDAKGPKVEASQATGGENNPRKRSRFGSIGNSPNNPINVDDFLSMFEPAILHDYGKDEKISLSKEEAPRIVCDQSFTVYDIDGNPHEFTPEFHHAVFHDRFQDLMELVYEGYINDRPPHIADPQNSCLAKLEHQDFSTMSASDIQNKMRHKQVVVTGLPFDEEMQFNANGLRTVVGSMTAQISITDFSVINPGTDCVPSVVSGQVNDLLENASSTGKILNGLDLPMWASYRPLNNYETDAVAWNFTRGTHRIPLNGPFPTQDREWGIAGLKHVLTFLHIDCDGFNTRYGPKVGRKLWAFLRPQDSKKLSSIDFYMDEDGFSLSGKPKITKYDFEAVVLRPGDELHMLPNSAHWVYGIDDVIAQGGHYYSSYLMQETLQGVVHAFVLNKFLTNTEHIPSRHLLRRILIFYQVGLIEGGISEDDPASVHLPNVETMEGVLNIICLAVLIILGNVLDFRTYSTPNQGEDDEASPAQTTLMDTGDINAIPNNERIAYCYARGVALHILKWLRSCATFTGPPDGLADDLISLFFVQILASLSDYKSLAEAKTYGGVPHCTSHLLSKQITNVLEADPILKAAWAHKERVPSHSLGLEEKEKYNVEWRHDWEPTSWRAPSVDFALAGQTPFDTKYFQATKLRINSENANMIVDVVKPPRKKAKVE